MSSLFWKYFKGLRYTLIDAGPLAVVAQGGAVALDAARTACLWLRDQFISTRCDVVNLEYFAASRGIVRAPNETEVFYQQRVRFAYLWHVLGGRDHGLSQALVAYFGVAAASAVNRRAIDPARWAEFRVVLEGIAGDLLTRLDEVAWAVNEIKPARSRLVGYDLWLNAEQSTAYMGYGLQCGTDITVYPYGSGEITFYPATAYSAMTVQAGHDVIIYPKE